MADSEHVDLLKHNVATWNEKRAKCPFKPDIRGANLHKADLRKANLAGADLAWSNLAEASLAGADLSEATLMGAFLEQACLLGAVAVRTDLSGVDLTGCTLRGSRFAEADCAGADFSGSNVRSIRMNAPNNCTGRTGLCDACNLKQMQINRMCGDTGVILAEGFTHPRHWPEWKSEEDTSAGLRQTYVFWRLDRGHLALQ